MFKTVLIANRGEIAVRAIRSLKKLGIQSVAVYSDSDRYSQHVLDADIAIALEGVEPAETYLNIEKLIAAAQQGQAEAIFPGYGFLSESAEFATACEQQNIHFIGPSAEQIKCFGLKHQARELAQAAHVPMTPGTGLLHHVEDAIAAALEIGYPVMLKSTAGGGGIGLTRCDHEQDLIHAYTQVKRLGEQFFKDAGVFLEKFIAHARHVEVQIFGDGQGRVVALGERDCTLQRRNQKVIEETPAPNLPQTTREKLHQAAIQLGQLVRYRSVGTVEFIYDAVQDEFYFLEVNTRLQVEHPITEMVTNLDLIECMLKLSACETLDWEALAQTAIHGAAIEVRIYAEDPVKNFQPSPGVLTDVYFPQQVQQANILAGSMDIPQTRIDTWVKTGTEVTTYFDPLLAKIIVHAADRESAIAQLQQVLKQTRLNGLRTNLDYAYHVLSDPRFAEMQIWTRMLEDFHYQANVIEVIHPGTQSTIQDYPGRVGYWDIGVPPSGPMDDYAFRLANRIVGNASSAAGFEFTLQGPCLKFHADSIIALTGAPCNASLDEQEIKFWQPIYVEAGQTLRLGQVESGCRTYLAIRDGLNVPLYLGSRSTFALGHFGGHSGRILAAGDMIDMVNPAIATTDLAPAQTLPQALPDELIPQYGQHWRIGVLYGPHGAPDFFKPEYMDELFAAHWTVHFNSNRLGIRLSGPTPQWARENGGEAGLHPSNIHDCEYAIGAINFTGDYPVILAKDGPSLGGFVCPVTIAKAELWKIGQLKADDSICFYPLSIEQANLLERQQTEQISDFKLTTSDRSQQFDPLSSDGLDSCVLATRQATLSTPRTVYRQAGDHYILLEYGDNVLDLALRLRIHRLIQLIQDANQTGILELSPGVRSLQIQYDGLIFPQDQLIAFLLALETQMGDLSQIKVPSRIVHLPMAFEDSATLAAVDRYQESVCAQAPWLPNNVDFIQRINGLERREQVQEIIFNAHYLVLGLGDVYLSAPCAVPIDPRHRLLSSKYSPARTFTAEGTVGIGGMYMCIYGMDSPGGYQLVGRTLPIWNKFKQNLQFADQPWFLRFFDQIKYFPVTEQELAQWRSDFEHGLAKIVIEETEFDYAAYLELLETEKHSIAQFKDQQQQAFQHEVSLWQETPSEPNTSIAQPQQDDYADYQPLNAAMTGNVWKVLIEQGQYVKKGDTVAIIEAMKMELPVYATSDGMIKAVLCQAGQTVRSGEALIYLQ